MKARLVKVEKLSLVNGIAFEMPDAECGALVRAIKRALPRVRAGGDSLDVKRFEAFLALIDSTFSAPNETNSKEQAMPE